MAIHSSTLAWKIPWTEVPNTVQEAGIMTIPKKKKCKKAKWLSQEALQTAEKRREKRKERKISEVIQSSLTPCNPMDCSLPGSSVHGIFQARVLEWVAISFSSILATFSKYLLLLLGPCCFCPLLCPSLHEMFPWYL